ncbi:uracil-DNA glycosylase [Sinisalibacter aestuarii]|uniref:Type-4 uracil-DNA glycosylase n=1 Tax=Sinisalibacter aestuarii TaxID=2949426 RepID=A0ABQ5LMV5_9RHOB|nr:uracil-DNA glycosylase [Sinisalibacter aestuarii]GKY86295.1 uracil-DNA glycosylase [Sinisalibacter aestuarii]
MDSAQDWHSAKALLEWYVELGAVDAVGDAAVDRYALEESAPKAAKPAAAAAPPPPAEPPKLDHAAEAARLAAGAQDLDALAGAMCDFDGLELKKGARNFVFADGNPAARVMILGEAPGADEDRIGRPFVGRAGQLLDKMLAAIGLDRESADADRAVYITNVLPWRPPGNRTPTAEEVAMMVPFVTRHIALADPDVLILMGNTPCGALIGRSGILRMRGNWTQALDKPVMPMTHPAYLLRNPAAKREAWADLLEIQAKLRETP